MPELSVRIELPLHMVLLDNYHEHRIVTSVVTESNGGSSCSKRQKLSVQGLFANILQSFNSTGRASRYAAQWMTDERTNRLGTGLTTSSFGYHTLGGGNSSVLFQKNNMT